MSSKQIKLTNNIKKTKAEMDKLEKSMDQMKDAKVPTQEYAEYQKAVAQTEKQLNSLLKQEQMIKDTGGNQTGATWDKLQYKIQDARNTLQAYKNDMSYLERSGTAFTTGGDTSQLDAKRSKYNLLNAKLSEYQAKLAVVSAKENQESTSAGRVSKILSVLANSCSKAWTGMRKLGSIVGNVTSKFSKLTATVAKYSGKALAALSGVNKLMSKGNGHAKRYGMSIGNVLKSIILYQGISKMLQGITTNLWAMLKTNKQFVNSIAQIKGNLLTAFQPIYDACLPAINALASGLAKATGYLAQFISLLFGNTVDASQSAASGIYDDAQALKDTAKAAKEAKKQLSDIDELHIISDSDSSSSSSSTDTIKPDFSTPIDTSNNISTIVSKLKEAWKTADFTEIGIIVGNKITNALSAIPWDGIQTQANRIAQSIATFLNGALYGTDWTVVGNTLGQAANTIIGFLYTGINTFDWVALGGAIYTVVNSSVETVNWKKLGSTVSGYANGVFKTIKTAAEGIKWESIGKKLGKGLQTMISGFDWDTANKAVSTGIKGVAKLITGLNSQIDWEGLGGKIAKSMSSMLKTISSAEFLGGVTSIVNSLISAISGAVKATDWKDVGRDIASMINYLVHNIDWVKAFTNATNIAVGIVKALAQALLDTDWKTIGKTICECLDSVNWGDVAQTVYDLISAAIFGLNDLLLELGEWIAGKIFEGLGSGIAKVFDPKQFSKDAIGGKLETIKSWFSKENIKKVLGLDMLEDGMEESGKDAAQGLADGLSDESKWSEINKTVGENTKENIVDSAKSALDEHSPSKEMYQVGVYGIQGLINGVVSLFKNLYSTVSSACTNYVKGPFKDIGTWFETKFSGATSSIKSAFSISTIKSHFSSVWTNIKSCFSNVSDWFKTTFTKAWTNVKDVFSTGGKIFDGIKDGIADTFQSVVNKLIDGINTIIAVPFNKINSMLNTIRGVSLDLGVTKISPFSGLWSQNPLSVPKIPKLATGTVVPANYGEFAAILGDNKREAEVVSPVSKIEEAVENVLNRRGNPSDGTPVQVTVQIGRKTIIDETMLANKENQNAGRLHFVTA